MNENCSIEFEKLHFLSQRFADIFVTDNSRIEILWEMLFYLFVGSLENAFEENFNNILKPDLKGILILCFSQLHSICELQYWKMERKILYIWKKLTNFIKMSSLVWAVEHCTDSIIPKTTLLDSWRLTRIYSPKTRTKFVYSSHKLSTCQKKHCYYSNLIQASFAFVPINSDDIKTI